jgi:hypothetical protein
LNISVARLRVAGPILNQSGGDEVGRKVGDPETTEAVEALLLDSELFQDGIERPPQKIRLVNWGASGAMG